jgi:hypothetical protein
MIENEGAYVDLAAFLGSWASPPPRAYQHVCMYIRKVTDMLVSLLKFLGIIPYMYLCIYVHLSPHGRNLYKLVGEPLPYAVRVSTWNMFVDGEM